MSGSVRKAWGGVAALLVAAAPMAANATIYNWSFASQGGQDVGHGVLDVDTLGHIVSGTGLFDLASDSLGAFSADLYANPNPGMQTTSPDGSYYFDNTFPVTNAGLLFVNPGHEIINIFANPGTTDGLGSHDALLGVSTPGQWWAVGGSSGEGGTLTITAVPEPASWALMIMGLGGLGVMLRRRRKQRQLPAEA